MRIPPRLTPLRLSLLCLVAGPTLWACSADPVPQPDPDPAAPDAVPAPPAADASTAPTTQWLAHQATGPIAWRAYGPDALQAARTEKKPLLLSIGWLGCTPCWEMDQDVWRDPLVAKVANSRFIPVHIDTTQRPDLAELYLRAIQVVTESSSLPLTVIAAPNGMPIAGGGTFEIQAAPGQLGLLDLMNRVADDWDRDPHSAAGRGAEIAVRVAGLPPPAKLSTPPDLEVGDTIGRKVLGQYDEVHQGYGFGARFPDRPLMTWLLRHPQERPQQVAHQIADSIVDKGLHDHIGGGFFDMTLDAGWEEPSWTKSLSTQAQVSMVLLEAWQQTNDPTHAEAARSALDFMLRELKDPDGAFYTAVSPYTLQDGRPADGDFYLWTREEVVSLTDEVVADWYQIQTGRRADDRAAPFTSGDPAALALHHGLTEEALAERIRTGRMALYRARQQRPHPSVDRHIALGPNALAVSALAQAHYVLDFELYGDAARVTATHLLRRMVDEKSRFAAASLDGKHGARASLGDHALLAHALLDLYEATGEGDWLTHAETVMKTVQTDFHDKEEGGSYWRLAMDQPKVFVADKPWRDTNLPSANGLLITAGMRLHAHTGIADYAAQARENMLVQGGRLADNPVAGLTLIEGLWWMDGAPLQVVIIPGEGEPAMHQVLRSTHLSQAVRVPVPRGTQRGMASSISLVRDKPAIEGKATVYLCREGTCEPGITDPDALKTRLAAE